MFQHLNRIIHHEIRKLNFNCLLNFELISILFKVGRPDVPVRLPRFRSARSTGFDPRSGSRQRHHPLGPSGRQFRLFRARGTRLRCRFSGHPARPDSGGRVVPRTCRHLRRSSRPSCCCRTPNVGLSVPPLPVRRCQIGLMAFKLFVTDKSTFVYTAL